MAQRIKGITVEIGGDTVGLQNSLKDVNKRSKQLNTELRDVERLLKFDPGNTELVAQKQKVLADQVDNTTDRLDKLRLAQSQVETQFARGDIGEDQYRAFKREVIATEGQLDNLRKKMDDVGKSRGADKAADDIDKVEKESKQAEKALKKMGEASETAFKGLAGGAVAGAAAIGGLVAGMQDLNKDLAKLKTNASNAGYDLEGVEEGFQKIAAVSGETDSAVETMSNLMATDFSDQQISQVIDEINGAAIRFSDTLKTEGIADGLQETFATGEAVGQFGELLERSGVSLDTFNAGLAEAKKNGSETDYVLQQLSELGLSSAYDEYKKLNPELVAQQEAQLELQMVLADLALVLTPLVTLVIEFLTTIGEWINENIQLVKSFDSIGEGLNAVASTLVDKGMSLVTNLVEGIINNLPMFIETWQSLLASSIERIAEYLPQLLDVGIELVGTLVDGLNQMLPSLAQEALTLVNVIIETVLDAVPKYLDTGSEVLSSLIEGLSQTLPNLVDMAVTVVDTIIDKVIELLPGILETGVEVLLALIDGILATLPELTKSAIGLIDNTVKTLVENLPKIIESGVNILKSLVSGIIDRIPELISAAITLVAEIVSTIAKNLPDILSAGVDILLELIAGIVSIAFQLGEAIFTDIIPEIVETLGEVDLLQIGKDIIQGLINGILSMGAELWGAVKGIGNSIIDTFTGDLDINSPSRVFEGYGKNINEGLIKGIDSTIADVEKQAKILAESIVPDMKKPIKSSKKQLEELSKIAEKEAKDRYKSVEEYIEKQQDREQITAEEEVAIWEYVKNEFVLSQEEKRQASLNLRDAKRVVDQQMFESEKAWINARKDLNELSLTEELAAWEQVTARYDEGSSKRIEAEQNVFRVREEIHSKLTAASEEFLSKTQEINSNVEKEEKRLNGVYEKAVEERTASIRDFAGLFDEVVNKADITGQQLLKNLEGQVNQIDTWSSSIEELAKRGIDEGLLEELRQMGPNALPEIQALLSLSDENLTLYEQLWKEKSSLARQQAVGELEGLKLDTQQKINELHINSKGQLELVKLDFVKKVQEIRGGTTEEFNAMKDDLPSIGKNAIEGLIDGMNSMKSSVISKAREIADAVSSTIESALDINSPSRVMMDVGKWIPEGLAEGMESNISSVIAATNNMAHAAIPNMQDYQSSPVSKTFDQSKKMYNTINISATSSDARAVDRALRRLAYEF
ncbi:hypothetical protein [Cytobacillus sp. IB215316]|uniref:phage tail protein n=1 Tax=Cytobacillus sp. IB215316 TaxID=3097354 RepID=UPI002A16A8AA|nr:hypothetical protein [Cytobacillus sp. IB215316]MDX8359828.1 hypothetical protein [Cytobacillus sp. IB215316]